MTITVCGRGYENGEWIQTLIGNGEVVHNVKLYEDYDELYADVKEGYEVGILLLNTKNNMQELNEVMKRIHVERPDCRMFFVTEYGNQKIDFSPEGKEYISGILFEDAVKELLTKKVHFTQDKTDSAGQYLEVKNKSGTYHIKSDELLFMEGQNHYVDLHMLENVIRTNKRLYSYEEELPEEFIRCHKGYIVNMKWVKHFSRQGIELRNGEIIPLGRTYFGEFRKRITVFFQEK